MSAAIARAPEAAFRRAHGVVLILLVILSLASAAPFLDSLTDETFLRLQFAKHIATGRGYAFNAGEPTYGAESPLWVFLVAAFGAILPGGVDAPRDAATMPALAWVAKALGAVFHALTILLLVRLGRRLGWDSWTAVALGALAAVHAWLARWSLSGMESSLATACVSGALFALAGTLLQGRPAVGAGMLLGLAALSRPECYPLAGLSLAAVAWGAASFRARRSLELLLGILAVVIPWLLTAWGWFHRLLPNSAIAAASVRPSLASGMTAIGSAIHFELAGDALLLALCALSLVLGRGSGALPTASGRRAFWILVASWPPLLVLALAAGGVKIDSVSCLSAVPCVILLGAASLRWLAATTFPGRYGLMLPVLLVAFAAQNLYVTMLVNLPEARGRTRGLAQTLAAIGVWAREKTPKGATFASDRPYAFGFYSERRVIDLTGVVTPAMAPFAVREGKEGLVGRFLYERVGRPEYLVDLDDTPGRWARAADGPSPYRVVLARRVSGSAAGAPREAWCTVYEIDWSAADATRERVATRARVAPRFASEYNDWTRRPQIRTGGLNHLYCKLLRVFIPVVS